MDLQTTVRALIQVLEESHVDYMFVGALASMHYGMPRTTLDVDVLLALTDEDMDRLLPALSASGFGVNEAEARTVAEIGNRFIAMPKAGPHRVDFWIVRSEWDRDALARKRRCRLLGHEAHLISPEDLVLQKLRLARPQDIDDALGVLSRQGDRLDMPYLEARAADSGLLEQLREALADLT